MLRLASMLYAIVSTTLAGTFIIAALVTGYDTLVPLLIAAAAGFALAVPVSVMLAKAIKDA
jgi:predicted PurR-regulated permease PerM